MKDYLKTLFWFLFIWGAEMTVAWLVISYLLPSGQHQNQSWLDVKQPNITDESIYRQI